MQSRGRPSGGWVTVFGGYQPKIRWTRSVDEVVKSHDGRFVIYPEYMGTTRAQGYSIHDNATGEKWDGSTQAICKYDALNIVTKEYNERRKAASK